MFRGIIGYECEKNIIECGKYGYDCHISSFFQNNVGHRNTVHKGYGPNIDALNCNKKIEFSLSTPQKHIRGEQT